MTKEKIISLLKITITTLIVVVTIYFSIWKVNFSELVQSFAHANYWIAVLIIPFTALGNYIRAVRWKVILASIHPEVKMNNLFAGVNIGYFMNNIIPRSGELARPYITSRSEPKAPFTGLLGTIVVERFIDVIFLLLIVASVLIFDNRLFVGFEEYGLTADTVQRMLYPMLALAFVVLFLAPSKFGFRLADLTTRPLPDRFREKVLDALRQLLNGFGSIKTMRQLAWIVGYSLLLNFTYVLPMYIMLFAFPAESAANPTLFDGLKLLTLTSIAFAVAPTPGAFGVFHITARISVMKILNFSYADAVAYATLTHFASYATTMLLGGFYLVKGNLSLKELMRGKNEGTEN